MPDKWPLANGLWSNAANWNGGTKPVAGDDVYADGRTLNVDESFTVATLRTTQRSGGTVGGTFNFNTSGVTGNVTDTISSLSPAVTNTIQVTATTGTVTLNINSSVTNSGLGTNSQVFLHSGNCNFNLSGQNFNGGSQASAFCINKSSSGTITITGNLVGTTVGGFAPNALNSSNGNTVVIGNILSGSNGLGISQTSGNLTITGNIIPSGQIAVSLTSASSVLTVTGNVSGGTGAGISGISFTGASGSINGTVTGGVGSGSPAISTSGQLTITGNVTGGSGGVGISTSANIIVIGNVTAAANSGISSSSANTITVTGTATASSTTNAISMTNANGQVYLNGNMVNVNGKMAIFAPIVWLDKNNTTSAQFFTNGGQDRTLYSANTIPNTPAANNVRGGTIYGAGNSLRGTIVMPTAANVRNGVTYDNGTVGTALFTTSQFITELSSSTTPVAVRMQNLCTPMILGELMEAFKK